MTIFPADVISGSNTAAIAKKRECQHDETDENENVHQ